MARTYGPKRTSRMPPQLNVWKMCRSIVEANRASMCILPPHAQEPERHINVRVIALPIRRFFGMRTFRVHFQIISAASSASWKLYAQFPF